MRVAALAGDRVDRLDVVRAHLVEHGVLRRRSRSRAPRLQLLPGHVIDAIDHRGGLVQQRDLVDVLDLAGIEHDLLAVDDPHAASWRANSMAVSAMSTPTGASAQPASRRSAMISSKCMHEAEAQAGWCRACRARRPGSWTGRASRNRAGDAPPPSRNPRRSARRPRRAGRSGRTCRAPTRRSWCPRRSGCC